MTVRYWQIIGFICVLLVARGRGQTTQPTSPTSWNEIISKVGELLIADPTPSSITDLVPDDVQIRQFGGEAESRYRLQQKASGMVVVSAHGYAWPGVTFASDLATDLRDSESLPQNIRKQFMPRDDADAARANSVAEQWIGGVLHPTNGQYVAVLVLWDHPPQPGSLLLGSTPENKQPIFVLLKGQKTGEDQFRIVQITYGDSRQALN